MLNQYRDVRYHDGGRGEVVSGLRRCDCWGFARLARADMGLPLLPAYADIDPLDKRRANQAFGEVVDDLTLCPPRPGALALCYRGRLAIHCGVCISLDGRLGVTECDAGVNVRWQPLRQFCRSYTRVEFYL